MTEFGPDEQNTSPISTCCNETIEQEMALNSMIMCPICRKIIKSFVSHNAYRHFVTFCRSRKREIACHKVNERFIVTYNSHQ